jgi:hypothetical protein
VPKRTKAEKVKRDKGIIRGVREHFSKRKRIELREKVYTPDELIAVYQEHLEALARIHSLTIERGIAIQREAELEAQIVRLTQGVRSIAEAAFGESGTELLAFGLKPKKKPYVSTATKRAAIERRKETRALRRTMGRRQKKKLKAALKLR